MRRDRSSGAAPAVVEDVSFDRELPFDPTEDAPDRPQREPDYIWVKYARDHQPPDGLEYVADPIARSSSSAGADAITVAAPAHDDSCPVQLRFPDEASLRRFLQTGATPSAPANAGAPAAYYSVDRLPPETTVNAFRRALKSGNVASTLLGYREVVPVVAWNAYVESAARPRRKKLLATVASDAEILASVGARRSAGKKT